MKKYILLIIVSILPLIGYAEIPVCNINKAFYVGKIKPASSPGFLFLTCEDKTFMLKEGEIWKKEATLLSIGTHSSIFDFNGENYTYYYMDHKPKIKEEKMPEGYAEEYSDYIASYEDYELAADSEELESPRYYRRPR